MIPIIQINLSMKKFLILLCAVFLSQVATAQECNDAIPASTPDSRFTVNGDEVIDNETGLIWQRCSLGQTRNEYCSGGHDEYTWQESLQAAEIERNATGKGWRLPNLNELESIVEDKCTDPSINLTIFPNTVSIWFDCYWSNSPVYERDQLYSALAWCVDFDTAHVGHTTRTSREPVRLVRDAQ